MLTVCEKMTSCKTYVSTDLKDQNYKAQLVPCRNYKLKQENKTIYLIIQFLKNYF